MAFCSPIVLRMDPRGDGCQACTLPQSPPLPRKTGTSAHLLVEQDVVLGTHAQALADCIQASFNVFSSDEHSPRCWGQQACQDGPAKHRVKWPKRRSLGLTRRGGQHHSRLERTLVVTPIPISLSNSNLHQLRGRDMPHTGLS